MARYFWQQDLTKFLVICAEFRIETEAMKSQGIQPVFGVKDVVGYCSHLQLSNQKMVIQLKKWRDYDIKVIDGYTVLDIFSVSLYNLFS